MSVAQTSAYIYGAGTGGQNALRYYQDQFHILGFIDSATEKHGTTLAGLTIFPPQHVLDNPESKILIASEYAEQIQYFLLNKLKVSATRLEQVPTEYLKASLLSNPEQMAIANSLLLSISQFFKQLDIHFHLEAGTLLGLYRDQQLIPWDNDLDFAIASDSVSTILQHLEALLKTIKIATSIDYDCNILKADYAFGPIKPGMLRSLQLKPRESHAPAVDLFIKYREKQYLYWTLASRGMTAPEQALSELTEISFQNIALPVPADTSGYLTNMYGDWQTPQQNWTIAECKNTTIY